MDNRPSIGSESLVVQMEDDEIIIQPPHPSHDIAKSERKWHPALAVNESPSSRLKTFSHPREPPPAVTTPYGHHQSLKPQNRAVGGSWNQRKFDTTERRQLQAQPRGARQPEVAPGVGTEEMQKKKESLRKAKHSSLTNVQPAESGRRANPNDTIIDFAPEGVRPDTPKTTSSDSETGISRTGDKVSTTTIGSQTSEESRKVGQKDRMGSSTTTGTMGEETEEIYFINEAWDMFEVSWKWQIGITEEEKQNGYRFLPHIDENYLGFHPRRNDKRKFLRAYPTIGVVPEARLGCNCPMPMTLAQWSCVAVFFIVLVGIGVGGYFYFDEDSSMA